MNAVVEEDLYGAIKTEVARSCSC